MCDGIVTVRAWSLHALEMLWYPMLATDACVHTVKKELRRGNN